MLVAKILSIFLDFGNFFANGHCPKLKNIMPIFLVTGAGYRVSECPSMGWFPWMIAINPLYLHHEVSVVKPLVLMRVLKYATVA